MKEWRECDLAISGGGFSGTRRIDTNNGGTPVLAALRTTGVHKVGGECLIQLRIFGLKTFPIPLVTRNAGLVVILLYLPIFILLFG